MNYFLVKALHKLDLLKFLNLNGTLNLNNKVFKIPILQGIGYSNLFISEPWMVDLLKIVLKVEKKGIIDVGVNIGQSLIKIRSVSQKIPYFGIEPNPICINYVTQLIRKNKFKHTSLLPIGISNVSEIGVLNFFYSSNIDSSASIIPDFRPDQKIERKEFIPLFDVEKIKKIIEKDLISIIKIDVEGAELEVLSSFENLIKELNPIILIEILPVYSDKNHFRIQRQNKIHKILNNANYLIYRVIKEFDKLLGLNRLIEIEIHSDLNKCDYVMVPKSKQIVFEKQYEQASLKTF